MTTELLNTIRKKQYHFDLYIGIDQTGAVNSKGVPKKLPLCILNPKSKKNPFTFTTIANLTHAHLLSALKMNESTMMSQKILICVDSALGLPSVLNTTPQSLMAKARDYSWQAKPYGAQTAYHFFLSFLKPSSNLTSPSATNKHAQNKVHYPRRQVELLTKANSVFQLQPFQKNIGCGTYRVLKNLAQDQRWYSLWPFEAPSRNIVIAEGYPSFFWNSLFQLKSRNLENIKKLTGLNFKDQDIADSFILAYGAQFWDTVILDPPTPMAQKEGWILGVSQSSKS